MVQYFNLESKKNINVMPTLFFSDTKTKQQIFSSKNCGLILLGRVGSSTHIILNRADHYNISSVTVLLRGAMKTAIRNKRESQTFCL